MIPWVNMGDRPVWLKIATAERRFGEKSGGTVNFLGLLTVFNRGQWTENPVAVFWTDKLEKPDHKHYFGLDLRNQSLTICDASSVAEGIWAGAMHPKTGEVLFSRYRHDYRSPRDRSFFVDGGRDYMRSGGSGRSIPMWIKFRDGAPYVIDPSKLTEEERTALSTLPKEMTR